MYYSKVYIDYKYYELQVEHRLNIGYNNVEAQIDTINNLSDKFDIYCKEVNHEGNL